jgi:DTW domain-containing protein YfiP
VDIHRYREMRQKFQDEQPVYRDLCVACMQPQFGCYCQHLRPFDPNIDFVILIHPIEMRRRIATGRMSHQSLENSQLIMGQDYSEDSRVNALIADPHRHVVILYPGREAHNLSKLTGIARRELVPANKKLTIFVIDGTWATARKTMCQSKNLKGIPRICFSPEKPSNFRVRKQPHAACYSTIEAIHQTIELVGEGQGFNVSGREHDKLIHVFDKMVELQLGFKQISEAREGGLRYRRRYA